jgi:hypothetical protein
MRVLFDQGTPIPLRGYLSHHSVTTVFEKSWGTLQNGELLRAAAQEAFDIFVTTDQNLKYHQNLATYRLAIVVLMTTGWPIIEAHINHVITTIDTVKASSLVEVTF